MKEVNNPENQNLKQHIEALVFDKTAILAEAVNLVTGGSDADPEVVFAPASEVREDDQGLVLSIDQTVQLREIAGRLGIGGEKDVFSDALHQVIEGGLAWKIESELRIAKDAKTLLLAGTEHRAVRPDEIDYMSTNLPEGTVVADNEFALARQIVENQDGFVGLEKDEILPFGYDISNGFALTNESSGQLTKIGTLNGADVVMIRVDREIYQDEDGSSKYRNQPDSAALLGIVNDVLSVAGDAESGIGLITSNTYASRSLDTIRAGLKHGRKFTAGMYGRQTLADVRGLEVAEPTAINQIPGELHVYATKLALLRSAL